MCHLPLLHISSHNTEDKQLMFVCSLSSASQPVKQDENLNGDMAKVANIWLPVQLKPDNLIFNGIIMFLLSNVGSRK